MNADQSANLKHTQTCCTNCRKEIETGNAYHYHAQVLCERCCIDVRTPLVRKTHWQYLRSIKAEYLIPGKAPATGKRPAGHMSGQPRRGDRVKL